MRGLAATLAASALAIPAVLAPRVAAEIYRWVDAEGQLHFSQSLDQVPSEQRRRALESMQKRAESGHDPLQRFDSATPTPARIAPPSYPSRGIERIPFEREGTLMKVVARLNDRVDVPFYVDTGASGISLPADYVAQLGIRVDSRTPRVRVRTANGEISQPLVKIASVQLGAARVEGLRATVSSGMRIGLLGGAFFNHFVYGVDAAQGVITLKRNAAMRSGLREDEWRERFRSVREPLAELETYLETTEIQRPGREAQLLQHRARLREHLRALETEAQRAGVPAGWRE